MNTAKKEGKLEASVLGAAMQTCGNKGWWEGLLELRRLQQEQDIILFQVQQSIAFTALAHCLKQGHKYAVVRERVPIALQIAKALWREVGPARDVKDYSIVLSSALKLATSLQCEAAFVWGSELWSEAAFPQDHISFSAYICFLEQHQHPDEVDSLLEILMKLSRRPSTLFCLAA